MDGRDTHTHPGTEYWNSEPDTKRSDEEEDGDFVRGYVLKKPKTPSDWVRRWAIQTSCNGIPNIQRTKSTVRLIAWVLIVFTGTVLTVYSVVQTVLNFFDYPFNVAVTTKLVSSLTFPALTVCNINPVRKSKIYLGGKIFEEAIMGKYRNRTSAFDVTFNRTYRAEMREDFDNVYATLNNSVQEAMGHQLREMLISCRYGRDHCNAQNFSLLQNSYYGNCYMINNGIYEKKTLQTHKAGSHNGMNLEFYVEQEEYVPSITTSVGMRVAIHGHEVMPFPEDTGLMITPGYTTLISLRTTTIKRLRRPYRSDCWDIEKEDAEAISVYSQYYPVDYSQHACQKTCYQRHVVEKCGCGDPTVPMNGKALGNQNPGQPATTPCRGQEQETCEEHIKDIANTIGLQCNCSVTCMSVSYSPTVTLARWPNEIIGEEYAEALKERYPRKGKSTTNNDPRLNIARVQIYFDQLIQNKVEEQPSYGLTNLYSDLGGNIGFYLGLSIVGMFEFFELILDLVGSCCSMLRRNMRGENRRQATTQKRRDHKDGKEKSAV